MANQNWTAAPLLLRAVELAEAAGSTGLEPDVSLVAWRNGRDQDVAARVPQRWFGVSLVNHAPAPRP